MSLFSLAAKSMKIKSHNFDYNMSGNPATGFEALALFIKKSE